MTTVTLFYRQDHAESLAAKRDLRELNSKIPFNFVEINISRDKSLDQVYGGHVPVVQVGPYVLKSPFSMMDLEIAIQSASQRISQHMDTGSEEYKRRHERGRHFSVLDRMVLWLSRHYVALFSGLMGLFVGLAFLAPVFMKAGWNAPAKTIYTIYSPFCHQLAFRSWFLFGEQAYYPRNLAGIEGVKSFEEAFGIPSDADEKTDLFILNARFFGGNESIGYKVALCQRDSAIYLSFLLFGLFFALSRRKARSIPWLAWLLIGVLPMGLDGSSQFPSLMAGLPDWLPIRESTPLLRTLTGSLFGLTSAWYLFPFLEESMKETRVILTTKKAVVDQSKQVR